MKSGNYKFIYIFLFIFALSMFAPVKGRSVDSQKNVLILNSYHQGFAWTQDETVGIIKEIKKKFSNLVIFVENMDWKNHPTRKNINSLKKRFKYKYYNKDIDIIITTDDKAFKFALLNRKDMFSDAPIVFCGVNQKGVRSLGKGHDRFTGVIEEVDPTETLEMALKINPNLKNVYVLFDNTESGKSTGKIIMSTFEEKFPNLNPVPLNTYTYEEIIEIAKKLENDSIILVSTFYSDPFGRIVEIEGVSSELSQFSNVPNYHLYDFNIGNGAFGGVVQSGRLQGKNAAKLALKILEGEDVNNIAIATPKTTRKVFDYQQLERFGINYKNLPSDTEIVNKPFSFFEEYRNLVISVCVIFGMLVYILILMFVNNKKLKKARDAYTYLAYHDGLTDLPNKLSLVEDGKNGELFAPNKKVALLYIDMDNFKYINDSLGHDFGDSLIVQVSERLKEIKLENSRIYRIGGDEFVILLKDIASFKGVEDFANKVLESFKEEFIIQNSIIQVSLSIGISYYPVPCTGLSDLLKNADIAMYRAKEMGRNRYVVYNNKMNELFTERMYIERYLRKALENNEFEIHYQPQYRLSDNKIIGFEALIRWNNSKLGYIAPDRFIKIAEENHLIIPIGTWVLNTACAFLKKVHEKWGEDFTISVNISVIQLLQADFNNIVKQAIKENNLEPGMVELEITESIIMESFETIAKKLAELKKVGVNIALDDFGTGYSSLSRLKKLPISTLKIDKIFIDDIGDESKDNSLLGQIIGLGKCMGLKILAEGVETKEQIDFLVQHGCDKVQGYYYSKPIPKEQIHELMSRSYKRGGDLYEQKKN